MVQSKADCMLWKNQQDHVQILVELDGTNPETIPACRHLDMLPLPLLLTDWDVSKLGHQKMYTPLTGWASGMRIYN